MKISAIDVGSNSVRLATFADGKTLYKRLATTRLGEGLVATGKITPAAIERTAQAIAAFVNDAKAENSTRIHIFATAAVRSAANRQDFLSRVKELCGIDVDVVGGQEEAHLGILGALKGKDGGIIDVGGASTEVTVQRGGQALYSYSADIGTVRLHDIAGRDIKKLQQAAMAKIAEYGEFDASSLDMYAIGGTATTLASVKHKLKVYDPKITDGTVLYADEIYDMSQYILKLSVEEVRKMSGMEPLRADVIGGGCLLTYLVMKHFKVDKITVSESDNLEGYVMLKEGLK
ncbi:MAG: hypothetical protein J1F61_04365 [Clostridiales bacterium]|nr:hypothetical protein [Clostridiales bacterium]